MITLLNSARRQQLSPDSPPGSCSWEERTSKKAPMAACARGEASYSALAKDGSL